MLLPTAVCLATIGGALSFQSPWLGVHRGLARQSASHCNRAGVCMVWGKKEKAVKTVPVSEADKELGARTEEGQLDKEDFPVLSEEVEDENIKVTATAWKWPPLWPYTGDYFDRDDESDDAEAFKTPRTQPYLDAKSKEALVQHYSRFLGQGADILEIGASFDSYLPSDRSYGRVVGLGMNTEELESNPSLTERLVQNINAEPTLPFKDNTFDAVLVPNSIEFFTDPRVVFREMYRVLKPEGLCLVAFTSKSAYKGFEKKQIKMWKTMNDAQHMWIIGSFFKFSANDGWDDLKGYDMSPKEAKSMLGGLAGKAPVFTVQATKALPPAETDILNQMKCEMYTAASMDTDDVEFCAMRLFSAYESAASDAEKEEIYGYSKKCGSIYDILSQIPAGVLFGPYKALLACLLARSWTNSETQQAALKESLGILPAQDELWLPLGQATASLHPEDKVILLADIVPMFDGNPERLEALMEVRSVLPQIYGIIKEKAGDWAQQNVELLGVDLLVTDFLNAPKEKQGDFIQWLAAVNRATLELWLDERKSYKTRAREAEEMGGRREAAV